MFTENNRQLRHALILKYNWFQFYWQVTVVHGLMTYEAIPSDRPGLHAKQNGNVSLASCKPVSSLLLTQRDTTFLHCRIIISLSIVQYRLLKRLHICCWDAEPVRMDLWPITGAAPRVNAFSPGPATVARSIPQDYGMQLDVSDWFQKRFIKWQSTFAIILYVLMLSLSWWSN